MAKFHINQADGNVGVCRAEKGNCPFGGEDVHFTSMTAAAAKFEEMMESETVVSVSKKAEAPVVAYGIKLKPFSGTAVTEADLRPQEKNELANLSPTAQELYYLMRNEVGPALTHKDATDALYYWEKNNKGISWDSSLDELKANGEVYSRVRSNVTEGAERPIKPLLTADELKSSLVERTRSAILAKRPYGFPEDEMSRSFMDANERQLIEATSKLSGETPAEVKGKLLASVPLERPYAGRSVDSLRERSNHIYGLTRVTEAKKREQREILRELSLRQLEAVKDSPNKFAKAQEEIKRGALKARETFSIVGTPSESELAAMDSSDQYFWKNYL